ncbi:MAG: response regulator transcription factor, partial [Chloroflexi bacterium]|nr:response regulator transcription factor [Chloroflexota bacterium]
SLRYLLQQEGHRVFVAPESLSIPALVGRHKPDLIILDKDLLEVDGLRPFATLREDVDMPLVLLVAQAKEEGQKEAGGFSRDRTEPSEERIRAFGPEHLRHAETVRRRLRGFFAEEKTVLKVGRLAFDFEKKQVTFHDEPLLLTPLQFNLLGSFALNAGRVMGYRELLENVWGYQGEDSEARELLKVHIKRIRLKMQAIAEGGERYIQSVRGFGYRLSPPDE